jgi:hypothetical protein
LPCSDRQSSSNMKIESLAFVQHLVAILCCSIPAESF